MASTSLFSPYHVQSCRTQGLMPVSYPSPLLPTSLLDLTRALLATARDCTARARTVTTGLLPKAGEAAATGSGSGAYVLEQIRAAESSLTDAQRQMAAVGQVMLDDVDAMPGAQGGSLVCVCTLWASYNKRFSLEALLWTLVHLSCLLKGLFGPLWYRCTLRLNSWVS